MSPWFYYEVPAAPDSDERKGSFYLPDAFWCEGARRTGGPWRWSIYLRPISTPVKLDQRTFTMLEKAIEEWNKGEDQAQIAALREMIKGLQQSINVLTEENKMLREHLSPPRA